jgi:hypothetical protein
VLAADEGPGHRVDDMLSCSASDLVLEDGGGDAVVSVGTASQPLRWGWRIQLSTVRTKQAVRDAVRHGTARF